MKPKKPRKPRDLKNIAFILSNGPGVALCTASLGGTEDMRKLAAYLLKAAEWLESQNNKGE